MLKIRLKRLGRKKQPSYRVVVIDSRKKRDGRAIEELGFYNPITKQIKINTLKIQERIDQGAQPTSIVKRLIKKSINQ